MLRDDVNQQIEENYLELGLRICSWKSSNVLFAKKIGKKDQMIIEKVLDVYLTAFFC